MIAEIITIGDEILIGQTIDTNSAWMGSELNKIGVDVHQISSVRDDRSHILDALDLAKGRAQLVLITGGLGPTKDDITKHTLCDYFETRLVRHEVVLKKIETYFSDRGREMLEVNRQQADLPESCEVLINEQGTASGMWFEKDGVVFVSMPGVPYEMKGLMTNHVMPRVKQKFQTPEIFYRTVLTQGKGESFLAEMIADWETKLRNEGLALAYLPSPGIVKLRISAKNIEGGKDRVLTYIEELKQQIPDLIYGYEKDQFPELIGQALRKKSATLGTAESCTGGFLAHELTSVSGSSDYYMGSIVSYANRIKQDELNVPEDLFIKHGAVSEEVVTAMVQGIRNRFKVDYAIATSGIMGPNGGSEKKPVGTVWVAVGGPNGIMTQRFQFGNHRNRNVVLTSVNAFHMLLKQIQED